MKFIAIHDRRGDFADQCEDHECLHTLSAFAEKVDEIRTRLFLKHNINVTRVLLASSEFSPSISHQFELTKLLDIYR